MRFPLRWFCAVLVLVAGTASVFAADEITGRAFRVVDGDTVHIGEHKIRLIGIDAPEQQQTCAGRDGQPWACGLVAKDVLTGLFEASPSGIACRIDGRDRYRRLLGTCYAGTAKDGIDVQKALIRAGLAVAEYAETYRDDEASAKAAGRGIWAGDFLRPKQWRRQQRGN